ncbi:MAG: alanine--glyoxylate aminotransferase family protein [Hyphomicrobiaceae bacterium]|nr:alanine--glyoxylate aminotransferase family protein [Hyphomicrobiaceae bacterium]
MTFDAATRLPADTYRLRLPGPIAVPERVRAALARPVLNHRGPEFRAIWARVIERLQPIVGTSQPVHLFATSGTGVMEAAILNIVTPGDRLLIVNNGQWGERFATIGKAMGAATDTIDVTWGETVDPAEIERRLQAHDYRALIVVHNESSTGVMGDLETAGRLVANRPTLLVTDTVSGLAGMQFQMDAWGVDIAVAGSQKALMCPPGLGLIAASEKAWQVIRRESGQPRFFFDLRRSLDSYHKGESTYTPAINLIYGLDAALDMIYEEGLDTVLTRHARLSRGLKAGAAALGLENFARASAQSNTVACFHVPDGLDGTALIRRLHQKHRTVIAGARNRLQGKVIRIGTMGAIGDGDILTDLMHLEDVLIEMGHPVSTGSAVSAASMAFRPR